ncbi:sigma-70 family RNA polymerase sigma factor [Haliangium sp.]|uniref:sigma-70 family RNA polymerase sigma factor n=1 Tax=Haliangium sp. TaxID=2663208 RepID=UPI003D0B83F6
MDLSHDIELVAALRAGDNSATREFVQANVGRMHAVARRIVGTDVDAQDVVQDAFLRAFQSLERFRGDARLSTWLHRIVVNTALMRVRSRASKGETESLDHLLPSYYEDGHRIAPLPAWAESADTLLQKREVRELVRRSIEQLPETHRLVLVLRDIEGLDGKETAEMLEISEGAVKTRLHRARQALRTLLEKELAS